MKRVRFTRAADRDLDDIWLEIAADNMGAADRFVDGLHELLQKLLQFPSMGAPRDNLLANARSFPFGRYLVFYKSVVGGDITVLRIVYGGRDLQFLEIPLS